MHRVQTLFVIAAIGASSLCAAAGVSLKAFAARVPALPATSVAAGPAFPAQNWALMPPSPPALEQLQQELTAATIQLSTPASPASTGAFDPAQAQAMADKLQSMNPAEQMAYAMQMQQQMMPHPQAAIVSPAEGEALRQLGQEQEAMVGDQTRMNALRMRQMQLLSAWEQADNAITNQPTRNGENLGEGGGTDFVCSENERSVRLKAYDAHLKLANEQLAKTAALDKDQRAFTSAVIARYERILAQSAVIKNPATASMINGARTNAYATASGAIAETAQLYDQSGRRAALWQHLADGVRKLKVMDCNSGG